MIRTTFLLAALLLGTGSLASAQERDDRPKRRTDRPTPEQIKRFDTNRDGKLDEAERQAARKAAQERRKNGEEKKGERGRKGGVDREALKKRFDTNKDGKLDEAERAAARRHVEAERARRRESRKTPPKKGGGKRKGQRSGRGDASGADETPPVDA